MRQYFSSYSKPRTPKPVNFREVPRVRVGTSAWLYDELCAAWREGLPDRIRELMNARNLPLGACVVHIECGRAEVRFLDHFRDNEMRGVEIPGVAALRGIPPLGSLWVVGHEVAPAYVDADVELPDEANLLPPFDLDALEREVETHRPRRRRRRRRGKRGGRNRQSTRRDAR